MVRAAHDVGAMMACPFVDLQVLSDAVMMVPHCILGETSREMSESIGVERFRLAAPHGLSCQSRVQGLTRVRQGCGEQRGSGFKKAPILSLSLINDVMTCSPTCQKVQAEA